MCEEFDTEEFDRRLKYVQSQLDSDIGEYKDIFPPANSADNCITIEPWVPYLSSGARIMSGTALALFSVAVATVAGAFY